jgi:hypothetical protein
MANDYHHIYQTSVSLENNIKNLLDDKNHHIGKDLLEKSRLLVSEINQKKKPRQLENRVKEIVGLLHHSKEYGELVMDIRHSEFLHHSYEHLQMEIRKFDDY